MSSLPSALIVQRYRAFANEEILPLRPITLLYGRNNAGKSALVRALAMLSASARDDAPAALMVADEPGRGSAFQDLAWKGDAGDYSFVLGLRWESDGVREVRYTLDGGPDRPAYVKELELRGDKNEVLWAGISGEQRPMIPLKGFAGTQFRFRGLLPPLGICPELDQLRAKMSALAGRVSWLDGLRVRPAHPVRKTGIVPARMEPNGANVAQLVVESEALLRDAASFYRRLQPPRTLEVNPIQGDLYKVNLTPQGRDDWDIRMQETGEGMSQVLPVLVGASLATRRDMPEIFCVEEAESHLHFDAQRLLAQHLCGLAARQNPPILLLETHSQMFMLGIQLAVAKGELSPEQVSLTWVEQDAQGCSTLRAVGIAADGYPTPGWPGTALQDDAVLASELARFSLGKGSKGSLR